MKNNLRNHRLIRTVRDAEQEAYFGQGHAGAAVEGHGVRFEVRAGLGHVGCVLQGGEAEEGGYAWGGVGEAFEVVAVDCGCDCCFWDFGPGEVFHCCWVEVSMGFYTFFGFLLMAGGFFVFFLPL